MEDVFSVSNYEFVTSLIHVLTFHIEKDAYIKSDPKFNCRVWVKQNKSN